MLTEKSMVGFQVLSWIGYPLLAGCERQGKLVEWELSYLVNKSDVICKLRSDGNASHITMFIKATLQFLCQHENIVKPPFLAVLMCRLNTFEISSLFSVS